MAKHLQRYETTKLLLPAAWHRLWHRLLRNKSLLIHSYIHLGITYLHKKLVTLLLFYWYNFNIHNFLGNNSFYFFSNMVVDITVQQLLFKNRIPGYIFKLLQTNVANINNFWYKELLPTLTIAPLRHELTQRTSWDFFPVATGADASAP